MKRPLPPGFTATERLLARRDRPMAARIDALSSLQHDVPVLSTLTIEWAGRIGHPSSYALLRGWRASRADVHVPPGGALFKGSLATSVDEVRWGLPPEFEESVLDVLMTRPQPVRVGGAAHGLVGSSAQAFRCVALMLCHMLTVGVPHDDEDIWRLFDRGWNEASQSPPAGA